MNVAHVLLTLAFAAVGAGIFLVCKIPGSLMVGAMTATIATNLLLHTGELPSGMSVFVQYLLGCYIGSMLHKSDIIKLKTLAAPAAVLTGCMTAYALAAGFILRAVSSCDTLTSLYATAPGGMVEVCIFAADVGANTSFIAGFHTLRTAVLYFLVPVMATVCLKKERKGDSESVKAPAPAKTGRWKQRALFLAMTLAVGLVGAFLGKVSGIPAGTLLITIIVVGLFSIATGKTYIPVWLKRASQIMSGAVVGLRCSLDELMQIKDVLPLVLVVILGYLLLTIVLGRLLARKGYVDLPTGIFSCCAGGVSDVTLVASDYNVDITKVVLLHLVRYFSIFITYPIVSAIFG